MRRRRVTRRPSERIRKQGDCWLWIGGRTGPGLRYGIIGRFGRSFRAHVYFYLCRHGEGSIPAGMVLDHLCNNKLCVNPAHLEPKTAAANCRRGSLAKLTAEIVKEIRDSREKGVALAERFGVSLSAISLIRSGKRWGQSDRPHCAGRYKTTTAVAT